MWSKLTTSVQTASIQVDSIQITRIYTIRIQTTLMKSIIFDFKHDLRLFLRESFMLWNHFSLFLILALTEIKIISTNKT